MATFNEIIEMTAHLPEVTISTSYGTSALKVRNKMFCRLWGERDHHKSRVADGDVLVLYCDLDEKEFLLAEHEGALFTAAHYDGHGSVLADLDHIENELLANLLLDSYLQRAPDVIHRQFSAD